MCIEIMCKIEKITVVWIVYPITIRGYDVIIRKRSATFQVSISVRVLLPTPKTNSSSRTYRIPMSESRFDRQKTPAYQLCVSFSSSFFFFF